MKRLLMLLIALVVAVASGFVIFVFTSADAQQPVGVALPPLIIEQTIRGEPGSRHEVGVINSYAELIGQVCTVSVHAVNNESSHPGSNIILVSGQTGEEVVIPDVEAVPFQTISDARMVTIATTSIDVFIQLGPDGVYSGAATTLAATCPNFVLPTTTTTTANTTSTTTTNTTTVVPRTTTTVPGLPVGLPHTL